MRQFAVIGLGRFGRSVAKTLSEKGHQVFLLEARLGETVLAARMMVAAAKALPTRHHRAYSLFDLPTRVLWKWLPEQAEREWL